MSAGLVDEPEARVRPRPGVRGGTQSVQRLQALAGELQPLISDNDGFGQSAEAARKAVDSLLMPAAFLQLLIELIKGMSGKRDILPHPGKLIG